jgi:hypothetical protein
VLETIRLALRVGEDLVFCANDGYVSPADIIVGSTDTLKVLGKRAYGVGDIDEYLVGSQNNHHHYRFWDINELSVDTRFSKRLSDFSPYRYVRWWHRQNLITSIKHNVSS